MHRKILELHLNKTAHREIFPMDIFLSFSKVEVTNSLLLYVFPLPKTREFYLRKVHLTMQGLHNVPVQFYFLAESSLYPAAKVIHHKHIFNLWETLGPVTENITFGQTST